MRGTVAKQLMETLITAFGEKKADYRKQLRDAQKGLQPGQTAQIVMEMHDGTKVYVKDMSGVLKVLKYNIKMLSNGEINYRSLKREA